MMKIAVFSFTKEGQCLAEKIRDILEKETFRGQAISCELTEDKAKVSDLFGSSDALIFISAAGIATRLISPYVKDKLMDPAVIVIDEKGSFVIPILSGHVGGANELSRIIADRLKGCPVITTATDVNDIFSVDEFAATNDLFINNREGIKTVSGKLLEGMAVNLALSDDVIISSDISDADRCALHLMIKPIVIGLGFKKEKRGEELLEFINNTLEELSLDKEHIAALATIDIKRDEPAIKYLSEVLEIPCRFYSADELKSVDGDFESSDFVEKTVGVSDVSGRAAKLCGKAGSFILKKKKKDGMTISIFEKYRRISFDYGKG